jgi:hypothetical protein
MSRHGCVCCEALENVVARARNARALLAVAYIQGALQCSGAFARNLAEAAT